MAGIFVVEDQGAQQLKGVHQPTILYRVVQPSGVRSRLDVAAGRLTPFVGRNAELGTLLDRWERAAEGEGQNVLVLGEAGVGKSWLAYREPHPVPRGEPHVEGRHRVEDREPRPDRALRIILARDRPAEVDEEPVAEVLATAAATALWYCATT